MTFNIRDMKVEYGDMKFMNAEMNVQYGDMKLIIPDMNVDTNMGRQP